MTEAFVRMGRGPAMELVPESDWWSALQGHMPAARRRFDALSPLQRAVRRAAVLLLAGTGRPVPPPALAAYVGAPLAEVTAALAELERRLFFIVRDGAGAVSWAFPVTAVATPHQLTFPTGEPRHGA
jgi:hypothetical protein